MEKNLLRIDLDAKTEKNAFNILKNRLSYMNDIDFLHIDNILKVELVHKKTYGAKIFLKNMLSDEKNVIILQLLLGSDWQKECNTLINHYVFDMDYSNRLFDVKRYKSGEIISSKRIDITNGIRAFIKNPNRKKNYN